jgi:predicted dehydrogenase
MRAKAVLDSGELGPIQRCEMSESYWRSDAYFQTSSWKATWKGEGGGVLLNQGAHLLDRYVWFCGMPEQVSAFCDTAVHPIEVEDFVSGIFRHADGVHGLIHMNTTENPALARTLISCDRGRLSILNGVLRIERLHESSRAYTASAGLEAIELPPSTKEYSASPPVWTRRALSLFYENFAFAVAGKASFLVPVEDAAGSLELANAMLLSCDQGRALKLPLDRQEYEAFIFRMQAGAAPTFGLPPA